MDAGEERCGAPGRRGPWPGRRAAALSIMTSNTRRDTGHTGRAMMDSAQPRPALLKASETPASLLRSLVRNHTGQHGHHGDVQDRANKERGNDADGHVALGVLGLLRVGGDRVEADVGEEDDRCPGQYAYRFAFTIPLSQHGDAEEADPSPAEGGEIVRPVRNADSPEDKGTDADHEQHCRQLDSDHDGVKTRTLANPFDKYHRHDRAMAIASRCSNGHQIAQRLAHDSNPWPLLRESFTDCPPPKLLCWPAHSLQRISRRPAFTCFGADRRTCRCVRWLPCSSGHFTSFFSMAF